MILSDNDIEKRLKEGSLVITPLDIDQVDSCAVDLKLGFEFRVFKHTLKTHIDPFIKEDINDYTELVKPNKSFILHPGEFVLASTREWVELPKDLAGKIDGRSSLGRLGIIIQTAGVIDPGFRGNITLEVGNIGKVPAILYPDMKIGKLTFELLSSPCNKSYAERGGRYMDQKGAQASKINKDKEFESSIHKNV